MEHLETVSKLYIFPNIFKMKRLSSSPHSVHFVVGVTRHLKIFLAFFFFNLEGGVLTLWSLARNPEFSTDYIYIFFKKKQKTKNKKKTKATKTHS